MSYSIEHNNLEELFTGLLKAPSLNIKTTITELSRYKGTDWKLYLYKCIEPNDELREGKFYKFLINKTERMEMYLIIWHKGAISTIHSHPIDGCVVKLVEGDLCEDVFMNVGNNNCVFFKNTAIAVGDISNKTGNMILHRIKNNSSEIAVSIHIYMCPGFQAEEYNSI